MEILIELIVWLVKSLFGDPEKTVDTSRQSRKPAVRPKRGPYSYGDESGGGGPKTLEEILQEARRQANQRKEGPTTVAPTPKVQRRVVDTPEAPPKPVRELVAKNVDAAKPSESIQWSSGKKTDTGATQPTKAIIEQAPETIARLPEATTLDQQPKLARVPRAGAKAAAKSKGVLVTDLLQAIRVASPAEKRDAARQAIVISEVFGPPRCHRPFRPGGILGRGR